MNKKSYSMMLRMVSVLLLGAILFFLSPLSTLAATDAPGFYDKYYSSWIYAGSSPSYSAIRNWKTGDKLISVKSSNNKVLVANKRKFEYVKAMNVEITPKRAGTAKVTIKVKRGKKTYSSTRTEYVINYSNPFKSVKVANKEYVRYFDKRPNPRMTFSGKKKVSVKTNSEWTLKSIWTFNYRNGKKITYKNNKTVNMDKGTQLRIEIQNKKTKKIVISTYFLFNR